jgi:hypothetical protein
LESGQEACAQIRDAKRHRIARNNNRSSDTLLNHNVKKSRNRIAVTTVAAPDSALRIRIRRQRRAISFSTAGLL